MSAPESTRPAAPERAARRPLHLLVREPAVPVLVLAGLTQLTRQVWADALVFLGGACVIVWDRYRAGHRLPRTLASPPKLDSSTRALAVGVAALLGGVLALLPRAAAVTSLILGIPGLLVAARALRRRRAMQGDEQPSTRSGPWGWAWLGLALVLALLELSALLSQSSPEVDNPNRPTVSYLVTPMLDDWPMRALALTAWLLCGWWLVRQLSDDPRAPDDE